MSAVQVVFLATLVILSMFGIIQASHVPGFWIGTIGTFLMMLVPLAVMIWMVLKYEQLLNSIRKIPGGEQEGGEQEGGVHRAEG